MNALTQFIIDLMVKNMSQDQMRKNWSEGKYRGVDKRIAKGYFEMMGGKK